jgi:hypothetical protein
MNFESLLKYILPDATGPVHRVAVRSTAMALFFLVAAGIIAFGMDTGPVLLYLGQTLSPGLDYLPLSAATFALLLLGLLFFCSFLVYACRDWLMRAWSGAETAKRWVHRVFGDLPDAEVEALSASHPYGRDKDRVLAYLQRFFEEFDKIRVEKLNRESKDTKELREKIKDRLAEWASAPSEAVLPQIAPEPSDQARKAELSLRQRILRLSHHRALRLDLHALRQVDKRMPSYKAAARTSSEEMKGQTQKLKGYLKDLLHYVGPNDSDPQESNKDEAKKDESKKGDDKSAGAVLQIEALAVECTMVDQIRRIVSQLRRLRAKSNGGGLVKLIGLGETEALLKLIYELQSCVYDQPYMPPSRERASRFRPRMPLGHVLERTSLGLGLWELQQRSGINYFSSANAGAAEAGEEARPGRLQPAELAQCESLREAVQGSIISATWAVIVAWIIGIVCPMLARPNGGFLILWLILSVFLAWRATMHLRVASAAAAQLGALESVLWQYAIWGRSKPQGKALWPVRLLCPIAPWRSQIGLGACLLVLLLAVLPAAVVNGFYFIKPDPGRIFAVAVAKEAIASHTQFTANNVSILVRFIPAFRTNPPPVRSLDSLVGTVVVASCKAYHDNDTRTSNPPWPFEIRQPQTYDPSALPEDASYPECEPVIGWKAQAGQPSPGSPPALVSLHVDKLEVAPPVLQYTGNTQPSILKAQPPKIEFTDYARKADLKAFPPTIEYLNTGGLKKGERLTVAAPTVVYQGVSEAQFLHVFKPGFGYLDSFDSGSFWRVPLPLPELPTSAPDVFGLQSSSPASDILSRVPALPGVSLWFKVYCPTPDDPSYGMRPKCEAKPGENQLDNALNDWAHTSTADVAKLVALAMHDAGQNKMKGPTFLIIGYADVPKKNDGLNAALANARTEFARELLKRALPAGVTPGLIIHIGNNNNPWVPQSDEGESQSLNRRVDIYWIKGALYAEKKSAIGDVTSVVAP